MKAIVALLLVVAAASASQAIPELSHPKAFRCPPPGPGVSLVPNPNDCGSYYDCTTGTPMLIPCPSGLHFNKKLMVCDWPANACCDPRYDPYGKCL